MNRIASQTEVAQRGRAEGGSAGLGGHRRFSSFAGFHAGMEGGL
jgi:hypothetical protein